MAKVDVWRPGAGFELPGTGRADLPPRRLPRAASDPRLLPGRLHPVCTKQFCSYRDEGERIEELGPPMVGISPQSVDSHERFADGTGLNVPLLADPDKKVARAYGVVGPGGFIAGRSSWSTTAGIVRYRKVALVGLRYEDGRRPRAGRARRSAERGRRARAESLRGRVLWRRSCRRGGGGGAARSSSATGSPRPGATSSTARARWRGRPPVVSYDARGHGESDPAPPGEGYGYPALVADLRPSSVSERPTGAPCSPGTRWAPTPRSPTRSTTAAGGGAGRWSGRLLRHPAAAESLAYWDALADGLERGGIDGFIEAYEASLKHRPGLARDRACASPASGWSATAIRRRSRRRCARCRARGPSRRWRSWSARRAGAGRRQLRRGRSRPSLRGRRGLGGAAPARPAGQRGEGESPLAWQGGRLSREIADFFDEPAVRERLS